MSQPNTLLVEGEADRAFFELLCKRWQLTVQVKVTTPRGAGHRHDSKQAAFSILETSYLSQLADGQTERLAIVIDADRIIDGGGFKTTLTQLSERLRFAGYTQRVTSEGAGLLFAHNDGLHDIGAWIMPNNADEGALEHWIQINLHPNERVLMQHAQTSMDHIPNGPKFKAARRVKAEVATWLAWQETPDHGLWQAARHGLLDETAPQMQGLRAWLESVFPAPP